MSGEHTCQIELEKSSLSVRHEQYLGTKSFTDKELFEGTNGHFCSIGTAKKLIKK